MPTIIDRGDGTFKYIADDNMGGGPEAIKRQTAEEYAYSPQARQELGETRVYVMPRAHSPAPSENTVRPAWMGAGALDMPYRASGAYNTGRGDIRMVSPFTSEMRGSPEQTLAHEYGHKTYFEDLEPVYVRAWQGGGRDLIGPAYYDRAARDYWGMPLTEKQPSDTEIYAQVAESPNTLAAMDPQVRTNLFPQLDQAEWDRRHQAWASNWPSEADRARNLGYTTIPDPQMVAYRRMEQFSPAMPIHPEYRGMYLWPAPLKRPEG